MGEMADITRDQVLRRDIPWETYMTAKLITGTGLQLLRRYDHRSKEIQAGYLDEDGPAYIKTFLTVLRNVTKEETIEYTLALIDDLLAANPRRARLFHDPSVASEDVYNILLRLLSRKSWFVLEKSCKILTLVISCRPKERAQASGAASASTSTPSTASTEVQAQQGMDAVLTSFVDWLCNQLRYPSHASRGPPTAISALATLLREAPVRDMLVRSDGVKHIAPLISPASSQHYMQLLYEAILCVWLLSFNDAAVEAISATRIVPRLVDVAKSSTKEKVVRVSVLTLKNLLAKGALGEVMVEAGLGKAVASLKLQSWGDEDLKEALSALEEGLRANVKVQSSFDKYKSEALQGRLEWTPMHKDPAFWRENVMRFEDSDFQVLRVLVTLLDSSKEARTLAVACHDLGQFIQAHPSGRNIALDLKAKERVMALMTHPDPEVQKHALVAVQKLLLSAKYASYIQA